MPAVSRTATGTTRARGARSWRGTNPCVGIRRKPGNRIASHAIMASGNPPLVERMLAHQQHATTAGYAHLVDAHLVETAERIGSLIADAMAGRPETNP